MSIAFDRVYDETQTYEDGKQYAGDDKLFVTFSTRAVKNEYKSNIAGRAIYEEVEYVRIIVPGSRDVLDTPLDDMYRRRFAEKYAKWKASKPAEPTMEGTLLAEMPWMTKSVIAELNAINVFTVEQLVAMPDVLAKDIMGNFQLRERARNFHEAAKGEAPMLRLQQELESRDLQIQTLTRQMTEMQEQMAKLTTGKKG